MRYQKKQAKDWAREHWHGLCNVIIPTFTSDLKSLNEKAIRHDVRRNMELGFWGALLVSETATTHAEYTRFMEIAVDEAKGKHNFLFHGCFDTTEDVITMADAAQAIGMEGMLLGHPNSHYPKQEKEIYDYIAHVCDKSDLAVVAFVQPHWNFNRFHPSGYPTQVALDIVNLDSVVACKYEVGGIAGHYDFWKRIKDSKVLYSDPMEQHFPISVELFGQQWSGTSGYELYGDVSPRIFKLLRQGEHEEAMKLHWQIEPARQMRATLTAQAAGANFIHRYLWKYWAWLHGYNGGPLRQPTNRLNDNQMRTSRDAVSRSGFKVRDEAFADFFVGRNPV